VPGSVFRFAVSLVRTIALLAVCSTLSVQAIAQIPSPLPAFPSAEGFGAGAIGGRGGRVIAVTTLADSGPGSLRAALTATGPRIVVFRVGGTINLLTRITLTAEHSFLTVAGQTAPGDGIQVRGYDIAFSGVRDIVLRYLRLRPGDSGPLISSKSSIIFTGDSPTNKSQNIIVDHCSLYWGPDETINLWDYVENVTFQWNLNEGMAHDTCPSGSTACQFEDSKSYIVGTDVGNGDRLKNVTLHHNLMANTAQRNPLLASNGPHHIVNNVVYNWRDFGTQISNRNINGADGARVNLIGNVYIDGPVSNRNRFPIGVDGDVLNPANYIYVSGNRGRSPLGATATDWDLVGSGYDPTKYWTQQLPVSFRRATPWPDSQIAVTITPTDQVIDTVVANAGATKPVRDALDRRVVDDVRLLRGFIQRASRADLLDYPTLQGGTAPVDTDGDGMPDDWERRFGLNPNDASDGKLDTNGDGYTNIEEYLNGTIPTKTLDVACNLDFSGDDQIDTIDATLLLRWLLRFRGAALVNGVVPIPAGSTPDQVAAAVSARMQLTIAHDFDGNGSLSAASDGLMLLRLMRGAKGNAAINATLGQGFTRGTYEKIRVHLNSHCGTNLLPE
jgi:pectate lyase